MKIRFLRNAVSDGLNNLATALESHGHDVMKLKLTGSTYRGYPTHLVINWGSSNRGSVRSTTPVLNQPECIGNASNKMRCFQLLTDSGLGAYTVPWTTYDHVATEWLREGFDVYVRSVLQGTQGEGITIVKPGEELISAPLYTRRVDYEREIRIHVFNGAVIDFSQKKRISKSRREEEGIVLDKDIRNTKNGWIFARQGVTIDETIESVSIKALDALDLDFGAIDMLVSSGIPKILEVNTAPGLEGSTVDSYSSAVLNYIDSL